MQASAKYTRRLSLFQMGGARSKRSASGPADSGRDSANNNNKKKKNNNNNNKLTFNNDSGTFWSCWPAAHCCCNVLAPLAIHSCNFGATENSRMGSLARSFEAEPSELDWTKRARVKIQYDATYSQQQATGELLWDAQARF